MFIQVIQGRATNPPGIRRDLGRWQRQLAADADGWLGSTTGITDDGWSITVIRFASEAQARRNSDRPEQREWWRDAPNTLLGSTCTTPRRSIPTGMVAQIRPGSCRSSRATPTTWSK